MPHQTLTVSDCLRGKRQADTCRTINNANSYNYGYRLVGTTIETFYQRTNEIKTTFIGTMIVCVLVCPGVGGVGYYDGYNVVDDVKHMWCTMNLKCVYTRMRRIDKCRRAVRAMSRGKST